jgi:hypothetical protein
MKSIPKDGLGGTLFPWPDAPVSPRAPPHIMASVRGFSVHSEECPEPALSRSVTSGMGAGAVDRPETAQTACKHAFCAGASCTSDTNTPFPECRVHRAQAGQPASGPCSADESVTSPSLPRVDVLSFHGLRSPSRSFSLRCEITAGPRKGVELSPFPSRFPGVPAIPSPVADLAIARGTDPAESVRTGSRLSIERCPEGHRPVVDRPSWGF